jgi:hypothetical protein
MSCEKWFEDKELDDHIVDNEMVELPQQETQEFNGTQDEWDALVEKNNRESK